MCKSKDKRPSRLVSPAGAPLPRMAHGAHSEAAESHAESNSNRTKSADAHPRSPAPALEIGGHEILPSP